jgi:hypothetical protein
MVRGFYIEPVLVCGIDAYIIKREGAVTERVEPLHYTIVRFNCDQCTNFRAMVIRRGVKRYRMGQSNQCCFIRRVQKPVNNEYALILVSHLGDIRFDTGLRSQEQRRDQQYSVCDFRGIPDQSDLETKPLEQHHSPHPG